MRSRGGFDRVAVELEFFKAGESVEPDLADPVVREEDFVKTGHACEIDGRELVAAQVEQGEVREVVQALGVDDAEFTEVEFGDLGRLAGLDPAVAIEVEAQGEKAIEQRGIGNPDRGGRAGERGGQDANRGEEKSEIHRKCRRRRRRLGRLTDR